MIEQIVLVGVIGYLVGSIQFARLVATVKKINLEAVGSGVASVANLRHSAGLGWAALATVGDVGKTLLPVGLVNMVQDPDWAAYVAVCVVVGHNWSVFARLNGGRGLLAAISAAAILIPRELIGLVVVLVPIALKVGDSAPSSLAAVVLFPIAAALMGEPRSVVIAFIAIACVLIVRRLTAPPRGKPTLKTLLSKLIFDRPDPQRHWSLEFEDPDH